MQEKNIKEIVKYIERYISPSSSNEEVKAYFRDEGLYKAYPVNKDGFKRVEPKNAIVAGVDGSNKEIITTPSYALQFNRVVGVWGNKVVKSEFISMSGLFIENNRIQYFLRHFHWDGVEIFNNKNNKKIIVDAYDSTLSARAFISPPQIVASLLRRFAEWRMISLLIEDMKKEGVREGVILRDGSLRMAVTKEEEFALDAINDILKSPYSLVAVVKRSSLISTRGINMIREMEMLSRDLDFDRWMYDRIADIRDKTYPAKIIFSKLHPLGNPLRMEVHKDESEENVNKIISIAAGDSNDPSVGLGYPYTLAKADRESNIKNYEIDELATSITLASSEIQKDMDLFHDLHEEFRESL